MQTKRAMILVSNDPESIRLPRGIDVENEDPVSFMQ